MRVWVLVDFKIAPDRYFKGACVDLLYDTEDRKRIVDSLIAYGIVSLTKPDGVVT